MRALPQEATFAATIHGVSALVLCKPILVKRANRRTRAVYELHRRLVQVVLPFWVVDTEFLLLNTSVNLATSSGAAAK